MRMNKPPVNSLNLEFLTDFTIMLEKLENEKACKGLVLTSVSTCICTVQSHFMRKHVLSLLFDQLRLG